MCNTANLSACWVSLYLMTESLIPLALQAVFNGGVGCIAGVLRFIDGLLHLLEHILGKRGEAPGIL